jgi:hypothetical protein
VKQNGIFEPFPITKAAGYFLDLLNMRVPGFQHAIVLFQTYRIEDPPVVNLLLFLQRYDEFFNWRERGEAFCSFEGFVI